VEISVGVEAPEAHVVDGLAGPRQKHIEDRQRPVDRPLVQLRLHVPGDEEAEAEQRTQRTLEISQRATRRPGATVLVNGGISPTGSRPAKT
jgi:3-keto-L-gulonate-6-phosphate decarboxylase